MHDPYKATKLRITSPLLPSLLPIATILMKKLTDYRKETMTLSISFNSDRIPTAQAS